MAALVEFEWERDSAGYRIERRKHGPGLLSDVVGDETECVVANGGPPVRFRPLEEEPSLFAILAATETTPEGVREFAERYGLLWWTHDGAVDPSEWYRPIESMREVVTLMERGDYGAVAQMFNSALGGDLRIRFGFVRGRSRPALHLEPINLMAGLWLQVAQHISSDHQLRRCGHCGTAFVFGSGTGRRRSGHYCSDRCRKAAWMAEKEGKPMVGNGARHSRQSGGRT